MARRLRVKRFQLANYKSIKVVDITPDGDVILASLENGQGKSSVLDGLEWLLRGPKAAPEVPVRKGTKKARGVGAICDQDGTPVLTVEREKLASGSDKLIVRLAGEDDPAAAPQSVLDKLFSLVAFEPLKLEKMLVDEPKKFAEELRKLVGVSTEDLDKQIASLTDTRRGIGHVRDSAQARAEGAHKVTMAARAKPLPFPGAPEQEVDVAKVAKELENANALNAENARYREELEERQERIADSESELSHAINQVHLLEEQLEQAKRARESYSKVVQTCKDDARRFAESIAHRVDVDVEPVRLQLASASEINRQVRANAEHRATCERAAELERKESSEADNHAAKYGALTDRIDKLREEKLARIAAVKMPVPGLAFSDDGSVTLNDLPLEQASEGERYRTYAAMAVQQNPQLRALLLRDSKSLGPQSRAILAEVAHEHGFDCWWETLDVSTPGALVLEDGSIVRVNPKEEQQ